MKAIITSIGERTTDMCRWSLERNGFYVEVLFDEDSSLAEKLRAIYKNINEDFLRVDADVIINRYMTPHLLKDLQSLNYDVWWWQFLVFDWYKQDLGHNMSYVRKEALPALRNNIDGFIDNLRPETEMSRLKEFYQPRRFDTFDQQIMGLHGYGIKEITEVMKLKESRNQLDNYDFELAEMLNEL